MTLSIQHQFVVAAECGAGTFGDFAAAHSSEFIELFAGGATCRFRVCAGGGGASLAWGYGNRPHGLMLSQTRDVKVFYLNFWWLLTPGIAIFLTVVAYNVLGDVLSEHFDQKERREGFILKKAPVFDRRF